MRQAKWMAATGIACLIAGVAGVVATIVYTAVCMSSFGR